MRAQAQTRKQILIVDDHPMMREGLAQLIDHEPDLAAAVQASTAAQALEAIALKKPDLALIDISLPDKNGLELIKDLQALHPDLPTL
ncbi:MAG: response regulator, partial [Limisphaerales bacterium]